MPTERDYWTMDAMEKYGGGFVQILSTLARHADATNFAKIKDTWPDYWSEYEARGREMEAKGEHA